MQEWQSLPSLSEVFLVEPDKLDIKRHLYGSLFIMYMYHQKILRHEEYQRKEKKRKRSLSDFPDIRNALFRKSVMSFNQSNIVIIPYKFYVLGQIGLSKQCRPRSDCF